jgi:hypothetical protein
MITLTHTSMINWKKPIVNQRTRVLLDVPSAHFNQI